MLQETPVQYAANKRIGEIINIASKMENRISSPKFA